MCSNLVLHGILWSAQAYDRSAMQSAATSEGARIRHSSNTAETRQVRVNACVDCCVLFLCCTPVNARNSSSLKVRNREPQSMRPFGSPVQEASTAKRLEGVDQDKHLWHGREAAAAAR